MGNSWRPMTKRHVTSNMTTLNKPSSDELLQNRAVGMFNDLVRKRKDDLDWKPHSRRTNYYYDKPKTDAFADLKRGRGMVHQKKREIEDPILQDEPVTKQPKVRK